MTDPAHMVAGPRGGYSLRSSPAMLTPSAICSPRMRASGTTSTASNRPATRILRTLAWVVENLADRRYGDVTCQPTPTGFVQQHVLRATGANGNAVELPACIVAVVDGDRITRIDEYLDSAHVARLVAP